MGHKKTITGCHEELIKHAEKLLQTMDEYDAMHHLKDNGAEPEIAFLVVKAAKILAEPYVYKEAKDRIIYYGDF
tara:strand:+ start:312 stop:533 length:222 start_codon:yes stop_codon:yes gene_type:complete